MSDAVTDAERLETARTLTERIERREPPDPELIVPGAEFSGSVFGVPLGAAVSLDLLHRLAEISSTDFEHGLAFREAHAAPGERVVVSGVATGGHAATLVAGIYSFRGRQVSHIEAFPDPADAFHRAGLSYPPADDVPRLGRTDGS